MTQKILLLVQQYVPAPTGAGVPMASWLVINAALEAGHSVTVGVILDRARAHSEADADPVEAEALRGTGAEVKQIVVDEPRAKGISLGLAVAGAMVRPKARHVYPLVAESERLARFVAEEAPDIVVAYPPIVAALPSARGWVQVCVAWDLDEEVLRTWALATPILAIKTKTIYLSRWRAARRRRGEFLSLLRGCDGIIVHSPQLDSWLRCHGVYSHYVPSPVVPDPIQTRPVSSGRAGSEKAKILLLGHMGGVATVSGLRFFVKDVLPRLEAALGQDFEVHIVGKGRPPSDLRRKLERPSILLRGFVPDIGEELVSAQVVLVPTPFEVGVRTRIIEAFAFGCCVVCHQANKAGIPGIVDGEHALMARTGEELANKVVAAVQDPALREAVGTNARQLFREQLEGSLAAQQVIRILESTVAR